ncbi:MAG: methylated-DNA--[protein]-cysteine S-methyltransferase [Gammaproteobacteria bacterium]
MKLPQIAKPNKFTAVITTAATRLGIITDEQQVWAIHFVADNQPLQSASNALTAEVIRQLDAFMRDPHHRFDLPLASQGTAFQQQVWQALRQIPSSCTRTYGSLAQELNTAARAIGNACRRNPIPIIIPCHRIIARHHLGGFSGQTEGRFMAIKRWLLTHEQRSASDAST